MGPVELPQRKDRLPQYARDKLVELQEKFDHLEQLGVFQRPEDVDITVEYLNPSFLVKKPNVGSRLVTAFADVGRYSKPQPSLLPDVDSTLDRITQWSHIIVTDLTSAFYRIPLAEESMKYCGVATPFKGIRVYVRSAKGMPGSETALEEVMCRVLGPLLKTDPWPKSLMICTAAATHPESYSTTGRGSYKPYTRAACVCLPTRPSSVPRLPLLSAGSGMLAPFPPVPTVLTPSPRTLCPTL